MSIAKFISPTRPQCADDFVPCMFVTKGGAQFTGHPLRIDESENALVLCDICSNVVAVIAIDEIAAIRFE